ncbi:MAG: hypothetical protein ACYSR6_08110 [Planctomycetota bacterium]|jgi:hypothetical protein
MNQQHVKVKTVSFHHFEHADRCYTDTVHRRNRRRLQVIKHNFLLVCRLQTVLPQLIVFTLRLVTSIFAPADLTERSYPSQTRLT